MVGVQFCSVVVLMSIMHCYASVRIAQVRYNNYGSVLVCVSPCLCRRAVRVSIGHVFLDFYLWISKIIYSSYA